LISENSDDKKEALQATGTFAWFWRLYAIEDTFILQNCGEEVLFYLKYEKFCAFLFGLMSLVNVFLGVLYFAASYSNKHLSFTSWL
jgi:hypothetical protein